DPVSLPQGIVDSGQTTAFVTNADKRITAVDLATGKPLWTSADIGRPLILAGQRLIAQLQQIDQFDPATAPLDAVATCPIGVLKMKDGKAVLQSEPLQVSRDVAEKYGKNFKLSQPRVVEGALLAECRSTLGPFTLGKGRLERGVYAQGFAEVDLKSGRAQ